MNVVAINGSPRNVAWTVKVIDAAKGKIDPPETRKRTFTNFIR